jgi:undecaprenyl-phosphate galactose phosphotransferase
MGAGLVAAVLVLAAREHYTYRVGFWTRLQDLCLAALAVFTAAAASAFLFSAPLPRVDLVVTSAVFPLAAMCFRWAARASLEAAGLWQISAVVVGDGAWPGKAAHILQSERELGYAVAACIAPPRPDQVTGASIWQRILRSHQASLLVLAYGAHTHPDPALVASLVRGRVPFALMPEGSHLPMVGARRMALAQDATLICYRNNLQKPLARATKILFDLAAAGAALVILAPVMLIIAVLVKLDGGPVFFAHTRLGAGGRSFRCLKFRSMVTDSEAALNDLFKRDPAAREEWLRTHKLRRDPRVTAIGHVLRMTSLDELPQLLNVLRLEMSLVGPRPIVSQEVPRYGDNIAYYYETRPGVTGLWQVSGRSDTTYAQRVHLDSWYVKNWTLAGDLSILARTIPAVLSGRGAG